MKKWFTSLCMILASVVMIAGCSSDTTPNETTDQEATEASEEVVVISVSKDKDEVLSEKVIEIEDGDVLMDVMKDNFSIEEEDGFIHSIDEVAPAEGEEKAWIFFVNGEMAMVGATEYELSTGDYVVFDLQAWE